MNIQNAYLTLLFIGLNSFAQQTGINTKNPQGILHVDSAINNPTLGLPTVEQTDDFIITNSGNVGIGTITPNTKLHIKSTTSGALRIQDGTQAANRLFVSDINGTGTWITPAVTKDAKMGTFPSPAQTIILTGTNNGGSTNPIYSGLYLDLEPGRWLVNAGITLENLPTGTIQGWGHAWLSTNNSGAPAQNGFAHLGPAGNNTSFAGVLQGAFLNYTPATPKTAFISGTSIIQVNGTSTLRIFLMLERFSYTYRTNASQNYFYAVPVN
ncbi:MAG: hypothetical protein KAF41_11765 [Flavobacterium sp.]|uniref:hypothetical protein n=1 Tax=Flavobacterium sp. Leaf359 TaxID=1736351 RepID=UPI0006F78E58|nr:hypothetical protein [Flavobacterium sp. Leaf359]KQS45854.1 hypothetical protein ASG38_14660 [Flavobacterium sp. Leaf359]MBU7571305.1 hypothetical protein [Flavobacterium sp.]PZO34282.1 MAG: hypothetical protein DCE86_02445 [Flavobacteriaceae bacterium]PZQ83767.1 MAG: hypothetical protein DI548_10470 [Flavobacterium johnsoniae]